MEETNYAELLPKNPPEGVTDWLRKSGKLGGDYIIYKCGTALNPDTGKNVRVFDCHCTACNKTFPAEYVKSDNGSRFAPFGFKDPSTGETVISAKDYYICPECKKPVRVYHSSNMGTHSGGSKMGYAHPLTIHNINGNLAMLCWYIERRIDRGGKERINKSPYYGYLFTPTKKVCFSGRESNFFSTYFTGDWKQLKKFEDKLGGFTLDTIYPWDASIWVKYLNWKIADTKSYSGSCPKIGRIKGLNLRMAKPTEMLGLNKEEMRYIKTHKWSNERIDVYGCTKGHA